MSAMSAVSLKPRSYNLSEILKIKEEGFILSNYTEYQFFIYQLRKRLKIKRTLLEIFKRIHLFSN